MKILQLKQPNLNAHWKQALFSSSRHLENISFNELLLIGNTWPFIQHPLQFATFKLESITRAEDKQGT
ncbi:MAG: hypothetical protein QXR97_05605, partial [Thermoproteota archaeon]